MQKQKFNMFLCVGVGDCNRGIVSVQHFEPSVPTSSDYLVGKALIKEFQIEVDVPEFNVVEAQVVMLEKSLEIDRKESLARQGLILEQIAKLRCISHEGSN